MTLGKPQHLSEPQLSRKPTQHGQCLLLWCCDYWAGMRCERPQGRGLARGPHSITSAREPFSRAQPWAGSRGGEAVVPVPPFSLWEALLLIHHYTGASPSPSGRTGRTPIHSGQRDTSSGMTHSRKHLLGGHTAAGFRAGRGAGISAAVSVQTSARACVPWTGISCAEPRGCSTNGRRAALQNLEPGGLGAQASPPRQ